MAMIARVGIDKAVEESHRDPSWLDAIARLDGEKYQAMSLELLFDGSRNVDGSKEATMLSRYSQIYH